METPAARLPESSPTGLAVSSDYGWFEANDELTEGFCFTWIAGLTPEQVVQRLGGRRLRTTGWRAEWESFPGRRGGETVMAVAGMPGWSLVVEDIGVLALRDDLLERLSARTTVVTHSRNVELDSRFAVIKNGRLQVAFDPYDPGDRTGSRPDALLADMRAAGFTPDDQDSDNADATETAFALTERLTGVPMTAASLHSASYLVTAVYDAGTAAWERENPNPGLQPAN
ncbi:DUF6461 domain-containing protein [Actinoplanes sp. L3-i22]|uniref:DUF6461 domain-containing protein n=1 Tax=Actinoplanes sp. L3-i22 TaxID=2836373 RepID=UPI001C8584EA|nr:DUF6461 domain-containing protein [Actinoplanes sp. L3-i22]